MGTTSKTSITVKPVTVKTWGDFEALFEAKGAPKYCWCMTWRMTKEELKHNNSKNRKQFIRQRIDDAIPVGLLAYIAGEPVAWCSVAPRETYQRLGGDESIEKVWSLACFFIKKEHRREGLVVKLIEHAKNYAKKHGARYLESYPVKKDSPSYRFMGYIESFERAKFTFIKKEGTRRHVMTCKL